MSEKRTAETFDEGDQARMRKEKTLMHLLQGLVDLIGDEASRNPAFASRLETLLVSISEPQVRVKGAKSPKVTVEVPDIYAEWQARGEQEFRLWLQDRPLEVLRALVKQHDLDPSRRTSKWKESEKLSGYIADQLQARLARGSKFMRG